LRVAPEGEIWVSGSSGPFLIFDSEGTFLETWGSPGSGPGQFRFHTGDMLGRTQSFDAERRYRGEWGHILGGRPIVFSMPLTAEGEFL